MKTKKGISLIVLVITIIVIMILAGEVIMSLSRNNPISAASEANFKSRLSEYNNELMLYLSSEYSNTGGTVDLSTIDATKTTGSYGGGKTIQQIVTSMNNTDATKYVIQQGKLVYTGTDVNESEWVNNIGVQDSQSTDYVSTMGVVGVNKPKLITGMVPIYWNGFVWINTTEIDTNWYDYNNKKWANAQTADGSMWIWIPRYVYKMSSGWNTATAGIIDIQFSKGINDNWNSSLIGGINTEVGASASNGTWTNQPAFTFGTTELTGIWVAKFEASNNSGKVKVIPNVTSWRNISENDVFNTCRLMETDNTYGWGTTGVGIDTHMMKNVEWGAVAYLTHSKYGRNGQEVWINPDINFITGRAGISVSPVITATTDSYETVNGVNASTTGNIYGIYDMAGGAFEFTAAYVNNGDSSLLDYGSSVVNAPIQYKDVYNPITSFSNLSQKKGDAIYETSIGWGQSAWFSDISEWPGTTYVFFNRGSFYHNSFSESAGGMFAYNDDWGYALPDTSFRPIILVSGNSL